MSSSSTRRKGRVPWIWGATRPEVEARYHCDELAAAGDDRLVRATTVDASPEKVFAWVGNLRVAPYSYDWVDNLGRRSPRSLREDLGPFAVGQRVMYVFCVEHVTPGSDVTVRTQPRGRRLFGDVLVTYAVRPGEEGTRLVATLRFGARPGVVSAVRRRVLAWGDLWMMRKQLLTLRDLAEAEPSGSVG